MTRRNSSRAWVLLLGLALPARSVSAATQHVTDCGDVGTNTLRGAISSAPRRIFAVLEQPAAFLLRLGRGRAPPGEATQQARRAGTAAGRSVAQPGTMAAGSRLSIARRMP